MNTDARETVLGRIRAALNNRNPETTESRVGAWEDIPREYDQALRLPIEARLDLLEERLRDYDSEVTRVAEVDVAAKIRAIVFKRGSRPTLRPEGFPEAWTPAGDLLTLDKDFSAKELDVFDAVVTGATVAIAETGTLVLQNVPGQGRRAATLVPDFHLCAVRAADVVETVPEAFARLTGTATLPTTFVSGPSATADIEMTRIKGVHGPRFLHVLLVTD